MRILIKDEQGTLTCIETKLITYDTKQGTLWLTEEDGIWETPLSQYYAEERIREVLKTGAVDLSDETFEFEAWGEDNE